MKDNLLGACFIVLLFILFLLYGHTIVLGINMIFLGMMIWGVPLIFVSTLVIGFLLWD